MTKPLILVTGKQDPTDSKYLGSEAEETIRIRADLEEALARVRESAATSGTWWTGQQRVAIWDETRRALNCDLCRRRKAALSPTHAAGDHDHAGQLPTAAVDAVHRLTTDASRLSARSVNSWSDSGLSDAHYVELVGIATRAIAFDVFRSALGLAPAPLPDPLAGKPTRYRPTGLADNGFFVAAIPSGKATGPEADLYRGLLRPPNALRALSLVPDEVRSFKDLVATLYIPFHLVHNVRLNAGRALDRAQIELLAARVSELNGCFY